MPAAAPDLEAMRRRLYSRAATEADRAAYRASAAAPKNGPAPVVAAAPRRQRPRTTVVPVAACAALLGAAVAAALVTGHPAPARVAAASAPPVPVATATAVPVGSAARAEFTAAVAAGVTPDVRGWFADHPGELPSALRDATTRAASVRTGRGPAALDVLPPTGWRAWAVTVVVVTDRDAAVTWTAERGVLSTDDVPRLQPVAAAVAAVRAGVPSVATAALTRSVPGHFAVHLPFGTRWSIAVVYSDAGSVPTAAGSSGAMAE